MEKNNLGKFDAKSDEALLNRYSFISKAYRVYNKRTLQVKESIYVVFDKSPLSVFRKNDLNDEEDLLV